MTTLRRVCWDVLRHDRVGTAAFACTAFLFAAMLVSAIWTFDATLQSPSEPFYSTWAIGNGVLSFEAVDGRGQLLSDDRVWELRSYRTPSGPRRSFTASFHWSRLGFWWQRDRSPQWDLAVAIVPLWCPASLALALGLARVARANRRIHRMARELCPMCGHDLRTTPGACGECGWSMHRAAERPAFNDI